MFDKLLTWFLSTVILLMVLGGVVGCGGEQEPTIDDAGETVETYSLGGVVTVDPSGSGFDEPLVLQNGDEELTLHEPGPFEFSNPLEDLEQYDVIVVDEPAGVRCAVEGGMGWISGEDAEVSVDCIQRHEMPSEARFSVDIDSDNSVLEVLGTETVVVVAVVENIGDETGVEHVEIAIGEQFESVQRIELQGGESKTLTFQWETSRRDGGEYFAVVTSEHQGDSVPVEVEEPSPAFLDVEINEDDSVLDVTEEETATISATVENTGDLTGSRWVSLEAGTNQFEPVSLELEPGETETVTFEWETERGDGGEYIVEVWTANAADTIELTVDALPFFDVTVQQKIEASSPVAGEDVEMTGSIENVGDFPDTQNVELVVGDTVEDVAEDVQLDPEESTTLTLHWETGLEDIGEHELELHTENDVGKKTVDVQRPGFFAVDVDEEAGRLEVEEGQPVAVVAQIKNTGDVETTRDIELSVDGHVEDGIEQLQIEGQQHKEVTLYWDTSATDSASYDLQVSSGDETATATARVYEPAYFTVVIDDAESTLVVEEEQTAVVAATIENTGEVPGTGDIELVIDTTVVDGVSELELEPQQSELVLLQWDTRPGDRGNHEFEVSTGNDSTTDTIHVKNPPFFTVDIDERSSELHVAEGQKVSVEARVENIGDAAGEGDVELIIDSVVRDTIEGVELAGGQTETVTLQWQTGTDDEGGYVAEVATTDQQDSANVVVGDATAPVNFGVDIDESESVLEVEEEETVLVEVAVENTGEEPGTRTVELRVDGTVVDVSDDIELDGQERTEVTLEWVTQLGDEGTYDVVVDSGDQTDTATAIVEELTTHLKGTVEDSQSGEGLGGVTVVLSVPGTTIGGSGSEVKVVTDDEGGYEFEGMPEGDYELSLEAAGLEPDYDLEEAGGDTEIIVGVTAGANHQDLTVDWLRSTDLLVDGGTLNFDANKLDPTYTFDFPECQQEADGSYEPVGGGSANDDVDVTYYEPAGECFRIEDVEIDLITGELDLEIDDIVFPHVELYFDDHPDPDLETMLAQLEWQIDDVYGEVDFTTGRFDLELDLRILLGGEVEAEFDSPIGSISVTREYGFWIEEYDCQLTGGWGGGDHDDPMIDDDDLQVGAFMHDPVEYWLNTDDGRDYQPQQRRFESVDSEFDVDRMSEGEYGADDGAGASCGEEGTAEVDFANVLNEEVGVPSEPDQVHWELDWVLP